MFLPHFSCPHDRFEILWHQWQWNPFRLWLALTPKQFEDLNNGKEIQPDEYSKRFGLRKDPVAAVERAQYFNDWAPEGPKGEFCAKDYVLVEVELTAIGYLQKPRRESF